MIGHPFQCLPYYSIKVVQIQLVTFVARHCPTGRCIKAPALGSVKSSSVDKVAPKWCRESKEGASKKSQGDAAEDG